MNVGGPAIQVSGLMRGLPPDIFEQRLVTGYCNDAESDYLETQDPELEAVRLAGLGRAIRPLDDAAVLGKVLSEIRRFRPHIVHTHTAKAGAIGRVAVKLSGSRAKVIHTYHGHLLHGYFNAAKTQAVIQTERILSHLSTRLVTVGQSTRDDLLAAGIGRPQQYSVIPPGLRIGELPTKRHARHILGLPESGPTISFIGRVTKIKRPDRFLDVASRVGRERPDAHFVVVGDGELLPELRREAQHTIKSCHFLGTQSDIETCLAASDAVVLTSDNEGTPISLIEAGMAGLPVVASDVGSVREVVEDGVTGWLASPTTTAISEALLELLRDRNEAERRGRSAQQFTQAKFGYSRFIQNYQGLYEEIIKGTGRH